MGTVACLALVAAFLAVLLKGQKPEIAMALGVAVGILILGMVVTELKTVVTSIRTLLDAAALSWEYGRVVFQAMGICLIGQLSADACRDAGEAAMAEKVELAGKILLVGLSLPLFEKIAQLAVTLINGGAVNG